MAKFRGTIGFSSFVETAPGVHQQQFTERTYTGEFLRDVRQVSQGVSINDDVNLSSQISIIADPFAFENIAAMRYVTWLGTKWKVKSVEHQFPRLIVRLGEVFNG